MLKNILFVVLITLVIHISTAEELCGEKNVTSCKEPCKWCSSADYKLTGSCIDGAATCSSGEIKPVVCAYSVDSTCKSFKDCQWCNATRFTQATCKSLNDACTTTEKPLNCCAPSLLSIATYACPDGSSGGQTCNLTNCQYYKKECPLGIENGCDKEIHNCLISPCTNKKCLSPTGVLCVADYCGGCNYKWQTLEGKEAECESEWKPELTPTKECECLEAKPEVKCANPQYFCKSTLAPESTTSDSNSNTTCNWVGYCPTVDPVPCDVTDCNDKSTTMETFICPDGETWASLQCAPVPMQTFYEKESTSLTSLIKECSWTKVCPPTVSKTCYIGGVCGDECYSLDSSLEVVKPNASECVTDMSCEGGCKKRTRQCLYDQVTSSCQWSYEGYKTCVERCSDSTPTCYSTDVCNCNFASCFWCQRDYKTDTAVYSRYECVPNTESVPCVTFSGIVVVQRPELCNYVKSNTTEEVRKPFDLNSLQTSLNQVEDVKKYIVTVRVALDSGVSLEKDIFVRLLVDLLGEQSDSITKDDEESLCDKFRTAVEASSSAPCKFEKVVTGSAKRALQQTSESSYIVTIGASGATPSTPTPSTPTPSTPTPSTPTPSTPTPSTPTPSTPTPPNPTPSSPSTESGSAFTQPSWMVFITLFSIVLLIVVV